VKLDDGSILRSIQSSASKKSEQDNQINWGINPETILYFDSDGNRI
jgi:hypothetical protein